MEKRFFLALLLTGIVLVVTPMMFAPPPRAAAPLALGAVAPATTAPTTAPTAGSGAVTPTIGAAVTPDPRRASATGAATPVVAIDTIRIGSADASLEITSLGGAPRAVHLPRHRSLGPIPGTVTLRDTAGPLLRYTLLNGADTLRLDRMNFRTTRRTGATGTSVTFEGTDPAVPVTIAYQAPDSGYMTQVQLQVPATRDRSFLLLSLPGGFVSQEADSVDDVRHLSYSAKPVANGAKGVTFDGLDPMEKELVPGPLSWAVAKTKYFIVGVLSPNDSTPFSELQVVGGARDSKLATRASGTVVIPVVNGRVAFSLYAGPQSWEQMRAIGREFETANPYGGFMQPLVQPFSTIVMRLMLWLKRFVQLEYGWVLVIFGLAIRIVLWPLNQSAMRSSIRLQRIQPELAAVQEKYKSDRTKQQQEIMRVYQEHGMSPFSALSGCLPALIPMPVFFALFFVFQNTIEFRGVPFLWLGDISLKDPLYILPIITGASMFVLSWIGMRNMPKNPQATMMLYLMPGMFTMFLLSTASGLSIYYLVQQIAAIPQQWLIANERRKAQVVK
jgi:YidC/Oxa1 family membrane protein insertase